MRKIGIALLGLIGGLVGGFLLTEAISIGIYLVAGQVPDSTAVVTTLRFLTPTLAIAGVVIALTLDGRRLHRSR
jgi:hypothetical protein